MKPIMFFLVSLFLLTSCGSVNVSYDYDENADFTSFTTYNYINEEDSGLNSLDLNRVRNAIDSILKNKNFQKSEDPSILIDLIGDQYEEASRSQVGIGVGGGSRNMGVNVGGGIPLGGNNLHNTLTVNIVDATANDLIWQAVSDSNVNVSADPQQRNAYFYKLMAKIFKKFPPEN